jgi:3-deoxy-D-manno-octulosonate 8-phosphate phosphatase (KDO 8-P phosphatase)
VLERARRVRVVLLDFDGVLTDGRIVLGPGGLDVRSFDVRDGFGIQLAHRAGLELAIVSGRTSSVLVDRARDLGIDEVHQGVADKAARLDEIAARLGVALAETCFMGDDLIDVPAMRRAGFSAAPADAWPEARRLAHYVTERPGGRGAVRELVELVLAASGRLERAVAPYLQDV